MHDNLPPGVTDYDVGSDERPEFQDNSDDLYEQKKDYEEGQSLIVFTDELKEIAPELTFKQVIEIWELGLRYAEQFKA